MMNASSSVTNAVNPAESTGTSALRYALVIGFVVIGVWIVPVVGPAVLVVLALLSLRDNKSALQAVTMTWLLTSLNPEIYLAPAGALRWLVLLMATLGVVRRLAPRTLVGLIESYSGLLVFGGVVVASAFLSSYPALTLSKLIGFASVFVLIVGLFGKERTLRSEWTTRWFMGVLWAVLALSAPLVVMDLGYVRNSAGFQGILNHPQALGIFLAPYMAAIVLAVVRRGATAGSVTAMMATGLMMYLTEARTGLLAAGIGVALAMIIGLASSDSSVRFTATQRRRGAALLTSVALVAVVLVQLLGTGIVRDVVLKSGSDGRALTIAQEFEYSRGYIVADSLSRFQTSPLIGNGFGVPADVDRASVETVLGGIPIGAPIESGIAVTGLLEQVGVLGLIGFAMLLWQVIAPVLRGSSLIAVALAIAALSTNLGEATIVSFGGMGLFVWLMIGWATVLAVGNGSRGGDLAAGTPPVRGHR